MEYTQAPLKLFLVHPGDEIFLCLEMFPYKADIKPVDISPQQWSETWISLEIKTSKQNWKLESQLSSKWPTKIRHKVPIWTWLAACFKQVYSKMMVNRSCSMPWTHHFIGSKIVLEEKCTSKEYEDFYYREQEIVKWITYNPLSPCNGISLHL